MGKSGGSTLMQSYYFYSAILALKFLALTPLAAMVCNPDKVNRAHISDLKNLTSFWLVAALYMTTSPDEETAVSLLRLYVAARLVTFLGYVTRVPKMMREMAFFVTYCITGFMGASVVSTYRNAL